MNAPAQPVAAAPPGLAHLPLPLLTIPMGVGGLGLAWRQAAGLPGGPDWVGEALLCLAAMLWAGLMGLHALRAWRHRAAMLAELRNPARAPFAAAPSIGLMILSAAAFPYAPGLGAAMWGVGVALHLVVALVLLRRMLSGRADASMLAPPLLIPFVGNVLAPVFGVRMGFAELSWMMFGIGFVLWLAVQPLLLHRLLAGPPLPVALRPSLAILVAPPAVSALALIALTGEAGGPVLALTGVALLVAVALLSLAREVAQAPFGPAWWGVTFPSAIFAALLMGVGLHPVLSWAALLLATALTGYVALRTSVAARAGALLRPEG